MKKIFVSIIALVLTACSHTNYIVRTVKITNLTENSGGSGTVLLSDDKESQILTNRHVCELVLKGGGLAHTSDGRRHYITAVKMSETHDLCLAYVPSNLHINTPVSSLPPTVGEDALIVGHPHLLPVMHTRGSFSGHLILPVQVGARACTEEDMKNPDYGILCIFLGKLPIIRMYDSVVTSALIQPGSSGSAVYNSNGSIAGVVFAGDADLGFGYVVPWEYVVTFLKMEVKILNRTPITTNINALESVNSETKEQKLVKYCKQHKKNNACKLYLRSKKAKSLVASEE